ncbi:MAG: peptide chain release factor 2 [Candidatus Moranbacteria bacterium]|nr:peptide chain release factor 2 [Candidatus Moranbacteria bacterium]
MEKPQRFKKNILQLEKEFYDYAAKKGLDKAKLIQIQDQISKIQKKMGGSDFWQKDQAFIKSTSEKLGELKAQYQDILKIKSGIDDLLEFAEMLDDPKIYQEASDQFNKLKKSFISFKKQGFSHKYDASNAIIQITAGAGGVDAQDWSEMLLNMYLKFNEKNNFKSEIISISQGTQAGIKTVVLKVKGRNAYKQLKSEQGVHRLVRLSPFNADNLRQTSFALVEVVPQINQKEVEIKDADLKIDTFRAKGAGGQHVNTTDSAVRITHLPTGIVVSCQNQRSQLQNKEEAKKVLASKLYQLRESKKQEKVQEIKGDLKKAEWGNQIRSYILHPYKMVKDHKSGLKKSKVEEVLNGNLEIIKNNS